MSDLVRHVLEIVAWPSVLSSILLGGMIGAFYGYRLAKTAPVIFPSSLWLVGIAFLVSGAVYAATSGQPWQQSIGRGLLWTLTCASIAGGRALRIWIHFWRLNRRRRDVEAER